MQLSCLYKRRVGSINESQKIRPFAAVEELKDMAGALEMSIDPRLYVVDRESQQYGFDEFKVWLDVTMIIGMGAQAPDGSSDFEGLDDEDYFGDESLFDDGFSGRLELPDGHVQRWSASVDSIRYGQPRIEQDGRTLMRFRVEPGSDW